MSHTNTTLNYNLPQFVGTDKPAWLTDINQAFSNIDTAIKSAKDTADTATGSATTANNSIGTLADLNTTNKSTLVGAINEVNTSAGTAQQTANTAINNANQAKTEAETLATKFNINQFIQYTKDTPGVTVTNGTWNDETIYVARNNDGSLFKIYGRIGVTLTGSNLSTITIKLPNTGIPANSSYDIVCTGFVFQGNNVALGIANTTITVKNNELEIKFIGRVNGEIQRVQLMPCLLIGGDFGDITPVE